MGRARIEDAAFEALWLRARAQRRLRRWPALPSGGPDSYHSLVVRLPAPIASELAEAAAGLPGHVYPPGTIHFTVQNLDGVDLDEELPSVRRVVAAVAPFTVGVRGLGVSDQTVFARLHPSGDAVRGLRLELQALGARPYGGGAAGAVADRITVANVVRFGSPADAGAAVDRVARHRRRPSGRFTVDAIELVHADKVLSDQGTTVLGTLDLEGG